MQELLSGTEVLARGLRWEVVFVQPAGDSALYRLRCLESALLGREIDLVTPFERIEPLTAAIDPTRAAQLPAFRVVDGTLALKLPSAWLFGLDELPGYDADTRTLRITREVAREVDAAGRPLAYLGRAHPIVRRALDRVRNVQFGGTGHLDRRVAVARGDGPEPEILYTYLGQVRSRAGRELERVIAVRIARGGEPRPFADPHDWAGLLDLARALSPAGVWDAHFRSWASVEHPQARRAAEEAFRTIAQAFAAEHRAAMDEERRDRTDRIARRGELGAPQVLPLGLLLLVPGHAAREEGSSPWRLS